MSHQPRYPDFEARVRGSFARQNAMGLIGARMTRVEPGWVEIELPVRDDLGQQHGFVHGGIGLAVVWFWTAYRYTRGILRLADGRAVP